ncbi:MAG: VOC family protein, partial [Saprospiraceae bacterium]|nr:VOC family protein [Saprospiraceae bacterium]
MTKKVIYGIQQVGVGVADVSAAFAWYGKNLCSNILVFDDDNTATHMAPYMGGESHKKRAILAINMRGGSGYELWQYLDRTPEAARTPVLMGDLGIFSVSVKSKNIQASFKFLKDNHVDILSDIQKAPDGTPFFFIQDNEGNILQIIE